MFVLQNSFAKDETDEFLVWMSKYTATESISINGVSTSYITKSEKPVMNATFSLVKSKGNVFYEDNYHTLIIKPLYDVWIDHTNKQIYISYKVPGKQKTNKYISPASVFDFIKSQIKDCSSKSDNKGGKLYTVNYKPTETDCIQSITTIDANNNLKSIEYYFSENTYLSKTIIKYNSISTSAVDESSSFNESKYVVQNGNKWTATKEYKKYKIQIFDYEELF